MQQLMERIRKEGKVLPGNIIKVDGFLNHRVDTRLMGDIADEFAKYFDVENITMVLTAEASGIALATICAQKYNVPMVFAKKAKSDNIEGGLYQSEIFSYTYKKKVTQILSKEWLTSSDRVLIVDDFMANGEAVRGLCDLVSQASAELVGIGIAVEKGFQGGDAPAHKAHRMGKPLGIPQEEIQAEGQGDGKQGFHLLSSFLGRAPRTVNRSVSGQFVRSRSQPPQQGTCHW